MVYTLFDVQYSDQLILSPAILDHLNVRGPAVTDVVTGVQYMSEADWRLLHPQVDPSGSNRLAQWTPTLKSRGYIQLPQLSGLMKNKTKSFGDDLKLVLKPAQSNSRSCLKRTVLSCKEAQNNMGGDLTVRNLTQACEVIVYNKSLVNNNTALFKWELETIEEDDFGPDLISSTTKKKYNLLSTTAYTLIPSNTKDTIFKPYCVMTFVVDADRTPFAFSYLLNMKGSGSASLVPDAGLTSWESITCDIPANLGPEAIDEDLTQTRDTNTLARSCQLEVICQNGLLYSNGLYRRPALLLLEVHAAVGIDPEIFRVGMEILINSSKVLTKKDTFLWQDPASCFGHQEGEIGSNTSSYYGLYYILQDPPFSRAHKRIPLIGELGVTLGAHSVENHTLVDLFQNIKLCALVSNLNETNFGWNLMLQKGENIDYLRDTYVYSRQPVLPAMITKTCDSLPWAWTDNIFQDPFVLCEPVVPLKEAPQIITRDRALTRCTKPGDCDGHKRNKSVSIVSMAYRSTLITALAVCIAVQI